LISEYNLKEKGMKRRTLFIIAICLCPGAVFNGYSLARGNQSKPQQNAGRPKKPAEKTSRAPRTVAHGRPLDAAAWSAARRFAETPFGKIAYVERGSGDAALFLHGFPLNGFQWRGALDRLSAYRRCVAPDFMGQGLAE
jgi:pimeloyl-ACP methyl ester carboxylesterase